MDSRPNSTSSTRLRSWTITCSWRTRSSVLETELCSSTSITTRRALSPAATWHLRMQQQVSDNQRLDRCQADSCQTKARALALLCYNLHTSVRAYDANQDSIVLFFVCTPTLRFIDLKSLANCDKRRTNICKGIGVVRSVQRVQNNG